MTWIMNFKKNLTEAELHAKQLVEGGWDMKDINELHAAMKAIETHGCECPVDQHCDCERINAWPNIMIHPDHKKDFYPKTNTAIETIGRAGHTSVARSIFHPHNAALPAKATP